MKKKKIMYIFAFIIVILISVTAYCFYYYYPRKISFEPVIEIQKPHKEYNNSQFIGFDYVDSKDRLIFWMIDYYTPRYSSPKSTNFGYDSSFVEQLSQQLNFEKYDYIITYQKELQSLTYSPYLTYHNDLLDELPEKPLIPTFDTAITDKVYIYRIKKNNKYRSPGP